MTAAPQASHKIGGALAMVNLSLEQSKSGDQGPNLATRVPRLLSALGCALVIPLPMLEHVFLEEQCIHIFLYCIFLYIYICLHLYNVYYICGAYLCV